MFILQWATAANMLMATSRAFVSGFHQVSTGESAQWPNWGGLLLKLKTDTARRRKRNHLVLEGLHCMYEKQAKGRHECAVLSLKPLVTDTLNTGLPWNQKRHQVMAPNTSYCDINRHKKSKNELKRLFVRTCCGHDAIAGLAAEPGQQACLSCTCQANANNIIFWSWRWGSFTAQRPKTLGKKTCKNNPFMILNSISSPISKQSSWLPGMLQLQSVIHSHMALIPPWMELLLDLWTLIIHKRLPSWCNREG